MTVDHVCAAQVTVYNLHGKNYIFTLQPTCHPIVPQACFAVASKTKKNILITLQAASLAPSPPALCSLLPAGTCLTALRHCCPNIARQL